MYVLVGELSEYELVDVLFVYVLAGGRFAYELAGVEEQNELAGVMFLNVLVLANDAVATDNEAVATGVNQYLFGQLVFWLHYLHFDSA